MHSRRQSARRLHNRVSELEPGNVDARLCRGSTTTSWAACHGGGRCWGSWWHSRRPEKSIRTVQDVARNGQLDRVDARFFCARSTGGKTSRARRFPCRDLIGVPRNYLLRLELSQMYSIAGDGTHALEAAEEVARLKTRHAAGYDRVPWRNLLRRAPSSSGKRPGPR